MDAHTTGIRLEVPCNGTGQTPASSIRMENLGSTRLRRREPNANGYHQRLRRLSTNPKSQMGQMEGDKVATLDVKVRASSKVTENEIMKMRTKLRMFYETPCEKWKHTRKFPFKLVLQLVKVLVVVFQLSTFAEERSSFERFSQRNNLAFHHVFLDGWGADREIPPYPPGIGVYAVYSTEQLYDHINHAVYQYNRFSDVTLTAFQTIGDINMARTYYKKVEINAMDETFNGDTNTENQEELTLTNIVANCTAANEADCYDIKQYLDDRNESIDLARLIDIKLNFQIAGINLKQPKYTIDQPLADIECLRFNVTIFYDNSGGNGQIRIKLSSKLDLRQCKQRPTSTDLDDSVRKKNNAATIGLTAFDLVVITTCLASFVLVTRSMVKRWRKMKATKTLFEEHYGYHLTIPEMADFMSSWYIQYIISDIFVIAGTSIKMYLRFGNVATKETFDNFRYYDAAAIMMGLASLFQWIGLIRYLGFFKRYYVLILTLSNAMPSLIRFLVCVITMYLGFAFSGWAILGPYNPKFETILLTIQTLFSLLNGDEIYATMSIINMEDHPVIWAVSTIYIYCYVTLFVFAIANLFIAVIMDSYESVKNGGTFKKTFMHHFVDGTLNIMDERTTSDNVKVFKKPMTEEEVDARYGMLSPFLCCFDRCVHHNINVEQQQYEDEGDLRSEP